jgi:CHASE2 domain-containing sensor protein
MDKLVVLELEGDFDTAGFRATLEIRAALQILKVKGYLPAAPEVATQIQRHWQHAYRSLGMPLRIKGEKIIHKGSLNRRIAECQESAVVLRDRFRCWLNAESFQLIDRRLREELSRDDRIRFLIRTDDLNLQKLPWHEWDFFERYPKAEVALSAPEYETVHSRTTIPAKAAVKVLAILGNSQGIRLEHDRQLLERLPHAEVEFLVEPDRQQLNDRLWQAAWDILFFAGHSKTEGESGRIYINQTDSLTLSELKYGLRKTIEHGLQLAIFNSCDGLGLVQELHQLHIPQMIVMREPVADQVATVFLHYFLEAFAAGESLYLAERQARERLQGLEHQFPCASWLPVIYQNPLVTPPSWLSLRGSSDPSPAPAAPSPAGGRSRIKKRRWRSAVFWICLIVTFAVLTMRWLGMLQSMELAAYDHLMRLRPTEAIDPRILVVEVTQADINQQGGYPLTDATLVKTIATLQPLQPVAIGLDMHRFQPRGEGRQRLITQFQQNSKLLTVCAFNQAEQNYATPPEFSANQQLEQVGFSNLITDRFNSWQPLQRSDVQTAIRAERGTVRRHLLSYDPNVAPVRSACATPYSLSLQLAYRFLLNARVQPLQVAPEQQWQFGSVGLPPLPTRFVGYQALDGTDQIMLNYRAAPPGQVVSLQQVLDGQVTADMVRDRIVLIGYTAPVARDNFDTPYGEMAGVWIHAHMVSQMLSAVLEKRPLIWGLPQWRHLQWGDAIWIFGVSLITGVLVKHLRSRPLWLGVAIATVTIGMYQICISGLSQGGWLPLIPALLALFLTAISIMIYLELQRKSL